MGDMVISLQEHAENRFGEFQFAFFLEDALSASQWLTWTDFRVNRCLIFLKREKLERLVKKSKGGLACHNRHRKRSELEFLPRLD